MLTAWTLDWDAAMNPLSVKNRPANGTKKTSNTTTSRTATWRDVMNHPPGVIGSNIPVANVLARRLSRFTERENDHRVCAELSAGCAGYPGVAKLIDGRLRNVKC